MLYETIFTCTNVPQYKICNILLQCTFVEKAIATNFNQQNLKKA